MIDKAMSKTPVARRTKSIKPTAATLAPLGAERLAELLMAAAKADPSLMRGLALEVAGEGGDMALEVDRQIARVRKGTGLLNAKKSAAFARELQTLAEVIVARLGPEEPVGAVERLLALLDLAPELLERRMEGGDALAEVFRGLSVRIGALLASAPEGPAKSSLAASAYRTFLADGYGLAEDLIGHVAGAIGPEDRRSLKALIEADWNTRREALGDRQGSALYRTFKIVDALCAVADADGDVDAFAAAQALKGPRARDDLAIARRLLDANRAAEALAVLNSSTPNASRPAPALADLKVEALDAVGQRDEAQALRWAIFEASLSADALRGYLKRLPDFEDVEQEERALAYVETHPNGLAALAFLLAWPDLRRAGQLVRRRLREMDGDVYQLLAPSAEALAHKDPLAATLLYRELIDFSLERGRTGRYGHAARHLQDCASLGSAVADWEGHPTHQAYVDRLKERHRYKESFWGKSAGV